MSFAARLPLAFPKKKKNPIRTTRGESSGRRIPFPAQTCTSQRQRKPALELAGRAPGTSSATFAHGEGNPRSRGGSCPPIGVRGDPGGAPPAAAVGRGEGVLPAEDVGRGRGGVRRGGMGVRGEGWRSYKSAGPGLAGD